MNILVKCFNIIFTFGHALQNRSHAVKGKGALLMYVLSRFLPWCEKHLHPACLFTELKKQIKVTHN